MTIRQITKEQFSSGTTIDGSRIEKALDDLYNRYNDPMQKSESRAPARTQRVQRNPEVSCNASWHRMEVVCASAYRAHRAVPVACSVAQAVHCGTDKFFLTCYQMLVTRQLSYPSLVSMLMRRGGTVFLVVGKEASPREKQVEELATSRQHGGRNDRTLAGRGYACSSPRAIASCICSS